MRTADTIAAIATGMTDAGIGIIRVSGSDAISVVDRLFRPAKKGSLRLMQTYTAAFGHVMDGEEMLDEAIVLVMRAPHTYTGEDVVEIQCHGGIVMIRRILDAVIRAGARVADPGEFTKRAFLSGRIDMSQAESVMDMIHAKNEYSAKASLMQLRGMLSDEIKSLREKILYHVAYIESALDDPEHYSLDGYSCRLQNDVMEILGQVRHLIVSADNGKIIKEGIKTVIVGKPNAGKSSLLNALLGEDRAIVTDIEGTTRDTLEESVNMDGISLNIMDTAGIRNTDNIVEKMGVDKAKNNIDDADLILYVVDMSRPLDENDYEIMDRIQDKKVIIILNKQDLSPKADKTEIIARLDKKTIGFSAKYGQGIPDLFAIIKDMFFHGELKFNDEVYITNARHKEALLHAKESLQNVQDSIDQNMPEDFFSIDLMAAYEELGYIIGESLEDDLVDKIFSEFCMGK